MTDILNKINQDKLIEVTIAQEKIPLNEIKAKALDTPACRGFIQAIQNKHQEKKPAIIAEIKKASPSKGLIRANFSPSIIAQEYEQAGATCLSVLTDKKYFQGALEYLQQARNTVQLPVLRKDFMLTPYQIYEAKAWGADAILLIATSLTQQQLQDLEGLAHELGLDVLVELHNAEEYTKCEQLKSPLFGVNNRNLRTFEVDLQQTITLLPLLKNKIVVSESGIFHHQDIEHLQQYGVHTFLVGESLMRQDNIQQALQNLLGIMTV